MRPFDRIKRWFNPAPSHDAYQMAFRIANYQYGSPQWPEWSPDQFTHIGYKRLALIFRCVSIIAHAMGTAPIRVYDENLDGKTVKGHPLADLMRRPNQHNGHAAFWSQVAVRMATAGFCLVEKQRDDMGSVIALWPLNSSWASVVPERGRPPDWSYRPGGGQEAVRLNWRDVIVFTWADSPSGSHYGMGPLEACMREVGIANQIIDFTKRFLENGAVPIHGFVPDLWPGQTLNQRQVDELRDQFVLEHGGLGNAFKPMILHSIKDVKRLGFDLDEMAYTDLRDLSELAITQAFGIPATIAQIRVGLEHSDSRANAEVDEGKFYRQTIIPLWARCDDRLTFDLLPDFDTRPGISLEFDTSDIQALQEDRAGKATWLNQAVQGGWFSVHAWHREMGLPLPPGDDYFLRSLAISPVIATDPLSEPAATALPEGEGMAALGAGDPYARQGPGHEAYMTRFARANRDRELVLRVAARSRKSIQVFLTEQLERILPLVFDQLGTMPLEIRERIAEGYIRGGAIQDYVDQYALESVDWDSEGQLLNQVLTKLRLLAGKTAIQSVKSNHGLTVGIDWSLANPDVRVVLGRLGIRVVDITETTRRFINEAIISGLEQGLRPEQIADNLRTQVEQTYANRSYVIARTESMVAYAEASTYGYRKSGVVDRAQIFDNPLHSDDYGASDGLTCASRDGIIVPLDDGMNHIYADHPNGSATIAPVLIGED